MSEKKKWFTGGSRLAMGETMEGWYVGYSPRNSTSYENFNNASVEGDWEDWVTLAKEIIAEDARRRAKDAKPCECCKKVSCELDEPEGYN